VVAFEVARYLLHQHIDVKGVLLIDPPSPLDHVPLPNSLLDHVISLDRRRACPETAKTMKAQFEMNSGILGKYDPFLHDWPWPRLALLRSSEGFNPPEVSDIPQWLVDRTDSKQVVANWESLVGETVQVWPIPGHHFQPFSPLHVSAISSFCLMETNSILQIADVALRIAEGCEYLEGL